MMHASLQLDLKLDQFLWLLWRASRISLLAEKPIEVAYVIVKHTKSWQVVFTFSNIKHLLSVQMNYFSQKRISYQAEGYDMFLIKLLNKQ